MQAGDRVEAAKILDLGERWLHAAQREDPDHEDVYLAAASLAMEQGDVLGALSEYQACLDQLGVDRPQILTSMGACALYGGRPDLATEFARRALAIAPNYADAQRLLDDARDGVRDESHRLWFY
jgi:tetratricopeptide (TPR) repeat protein